MKSTVCKQDFVRAFDDYGRSNNFSVNGREALFDYLEELEQDTGEEIELDVISICCEFSEYENLAELKEDYPDIESLDELRNETQVIEIDEESFIIQLF